MKTLLNGDLSHKRVTLPRLTNHSPCNPSIVVHKNRILSSYRGCNYQLRESGYRFWYGSGATALPDSQNYLAELSKSMECLSAEFIEDRHVRSRRTCLDGLEDLRIFSWNHELYAIGNGINNSHASQHEGRAESTIVLGKIINNRFNSIAELKTAQRTEKNWMPWVLKGKLHFIYMACPLTVFRYDETERVMKSVHIPNAAGLPKASGSSCVIPYKDGFLGVLHAKEGFGRRSKYTHYLFRISTQFDILDVSAPFTFEGEDVEFCAGVAIHGEHIYFSYGIFDEQAVILRLNCERTMAYLFGHA